jgi:hypothetical protein
MGRKLVFWLSLAAFIFLNLGCHNFTYKTSKKNIETVMSWSSGKIQRAEVLEVIKKSGDSVVFLPTQPAKIEGGSIKSSKARRERVEIDRGDIEKSVEVSRDILSVTTRDGQTHVLYDYQSLEDRIVGNVLKTIDPIPLSEVEAVWLRFKKFKVDRNFESIFLGVGVAVVVLIGGAILF